VLYSLTFKSKRFIFESNQPINIIKQKPMKKLYSVIAISLFSIAASAQCMITSGPTVTPNGLSISVTGTGTGATFPVYVYDWGDQTSPGTTQTSTHTYASAGTYTLCMYYADGANTSCIDTNCTQVTVSATGINDPSATAMDISAVPNPFGSDVTFTFALTQSENVEAAIYDMTGKQVVVLKDGIMASGINRIDWKPAGLSAGVYFLRVNAGNSVITKKIVYTQN
jgi:PKD repeat protein